MKKVKKGTWGYIRYEKKKRLLITLVMFAIPLLIYVTGYVQTKTRLNLFTVVAILGSLPACKSMVSLIMILMQKSAPADTYEAARKAAGTLTGGYEMVFTTYEHTTPVQALVVCGDLVIGYTADEKADPAALEKHISKILAANGYPDAQVKILKELKTYLQRVSDVCKKQEHYREGLAFTPDTRYPELSRDEVILHTLLAICL